MCANLLVTPLETLPRSRYSEDVVSRMGELGTKRHRLAEQLSKLPSLIVAYSGGVDSAYLAYAAHQAMGDRMLAVTALSASYSARDREEAEKCVAHGHLPARVYRH